MTWWLRDQLGLHENDGFLKVDRPKVARISRSGVGGGRHRKRAKELLFASEVSYTRDEEVRGSSRGSLGLPSPIDLAQQLKSTEKEGAEMGDDAQEHGSPSALERWRNRKHSETGHDADHIHHEEILPPTVAATQRPEAGAVAAEEEAGDVPAEAAPEVEHVVEGSAPAPGTESAEASVPVEGVEEGAAPPAEGDDVAESSASGETDVPAGAPAEGVPPPGGGAPQHGAAAPPGAAAQAGSKLDRWKSRVAKQAEVANAAAPPAAPPPANAAQAPTSGKLDRWKKRIATQAAGTAGGGASPAPAAASPAGAPGAQQDPTLPTSQGVDPTLPTSQGGKRGHPDPRMDAWLRRALEKRWNQPLVAGAGGVYLRLI